MKLYNEAIFDVLRKIALLGYENDFALIPLTGTQVLEKIKTDIKLDMTDNPQFIMSEEIAHDQREYHHFEIIFKTEYHTKFRDVDTGLITILPNSDYAKRYQWEEDLNKGLL